MTQSALTATLLLCTLSGCSIVQRVDPVPQKLDLLCIEKNDDIFMDDYLSIIERNIAEVKVPSKTIAPNASSDCPAIMRYKANWAWDMAMYLKFANFSVFKGQDRIGYGEYNSAGGGFRFDKFGTTEDKIKPIIREMFKNQK